MDCTGLTLTPGFIDSHTHSDLQVIEGRTEKLRQGVTTEVVGNCGFSAYPPSRNPADLRSFANGIFCGDDEWGWPSTEAYLRAIETSSTANVVSLVGHGSLRIAVAGNKQGPLSESGSSLYGKPACRSSGCRRCGPLYWPDVCSGLERTNGGVAASLQRGGTKRQKIYTSHIRSYFSELVDAVDEQIDLARHSGGRLQISHLQAVGASNWHLQRRAIDSMEKAQRRRN